MSKTKIKILDTARELFNREGYSQVTIRMVAQALNMSSGNLNYHFKKREDILEALYFEMVSVFDKRIEKLESTSFTLKSIKADIYESMQRMVVYGFFWTDLFQILRINEKVKNHFDTVYQHRLNGLHYLFQELEKQEILKSFEFEKEAEYLAKRMIEYGNTWLYNSSLYGNKIDDTYIDEQANSMLAMLYPYFSDKGKEAFRELLPNHFHGE